MNMMSGNRYAFRAVSFLMLLLLLHLTTYDVFAAQAGQKDDESKESVLAGRAFDEYKLDKSKSSECKGTIINIPGDSQNVLCRKPKADLPVHIVNVGNGQGMDT